MCSIADSKPGKITAVDLPATFLMAFALSHSPTFID